METASVMPVAQPVAEGQKSNGIGGILLLSALAFATTILYRVSTANKAQAKTTVKKDDSKKDTKGTVSSADVSSSQTVSNVEGTKKVQKTVPSKAQTHSQAKQNIAKQNPVQQPVEGVKIVGKVSLNDAKRNEQARIKKQAVLKRINELTERLKGVGRTYDEHRRAIGIKNELTLLRAQAQLI